MLSKSIFIASCTVTSKSARWHTESRARDLLREIKLYNDRSYPHLVLFVIGSQSSNHSRTNGWRFVWVFPPYKAASCSPLSLQENYVSHLNAIGPRRRYRGSARADECYALSSGPKLAAAVARGGGLGFLSGANRTPAEITKEFAHAKELMCNGAFF